HYDVSQDGTLAYVSASVNPGFTLVWRDRRSGSEQPLPVSPDSYWAPRLSPDGERIAVVRSGLGEAAEPRFEITLINASTGTADSCANGVWPEWTPDGGSLVFNRYGGVLPLVRRAIDRRDAPEIVLTSRRLPLLAAFSRKPVVMSFQTPVGSGD